MVSRIKKITKYPALMNFLGAMFFVSIIIVSSVGYVYVKNSYLKNTTEDLHGIVNVIQDNITHYIEAEMQKTYDIAQSSFVVDFLQGKTKQEAFAKFLQKYIEDHMPISVVMFSAQHEPIFASDGQLASYAHQEPLQTSIQRSLILSGPDVSDFIFNSTDNKHMLLITAPVIANHEFLGSIAIELPTDRILKLLTDYYHNLGKTGEILIGKKMHDDIVAIFPTRFNPDAAFNKKVPYTALKQAVNGERGSSIMIDYQKQKSLIIWQYMPLTEWGLDIKMSYDELMQSLRPFKIFILLLVLLSTCGALYCFYRSWRHMREKGSLDIVVSKTLRSLLYIFFIINSIVLVTVIAHYYQARKMRIQKHTTAFDVAVQIAAQQMGYHIFSLEAIAHALAFDVGNEIVDAQSLQARIKKDTQDNPGIANIMVDFKRALEQAPAWSSIENGAVQGESDLVYTVPFYGKQDLEHKMASGVIGIVYPKKAFLAIAREQLGTKHPLEILDGARKVMYQDKELGKSTVHFEKIPHLGWYLGSAMPAIDSSLRNLFILCIGIILGLCILIIIAYRLMRYCTSQYTEKRNNSLLLYALVAVMLLTCMQYMVMLQ